MTFDSILVCSISKMFNQFSDHKYNFVWYLYESFGGYDFEAFYMVCNILHCYKKFIRIYL